MPSLAFRKASICSRFSFSASCTLVVNPQHATRSRLILYWKPPPPSGSSCIGKDSPGTEDPVKWHAGLIAAPQSGQTICVLAERVHDVAARGVMAHRKTAKLIWRRVQRYSIPDRKK